MGVRERTDKERDAASYGDLYRRAAAITALRHAEFEAQSPQFRTGSHAWGRYDGVFSFRFSTITTALTNSVETEPGLSMPSTEELATPGGVTPVSAASPTRHFEEI